jgi:tetratricopeptide (TPR) repeat protein
VDNLPLLVDRLMSQVLAGEAGRTDLASLTTLPAIRAYLDGKSAIRAGHFDEALKDFDHALRIDSTFVLAALEFQEASGWASGWLPTEYGPRGVLLAWPLRERLSPRDRALLVAHAGPRFPLPASGAEFLEAAEQAVAAAPERAEAWYKLGDEYFHFGALLSLPHPLGQAAAAAFRRAEELDSAAGRRPDAGPLHHLLEIAAFERDTAAVRRLGARVLANSGTDDPNAARWLMAYVLGDSAALSKLRARFNQMSFGSLTDISLESQQMGLAPEDARRAVNAMLSTAKTESERRWGLAHLYGLALNGGRPAEAQAALRQHGGKTRVVPSDR